MLMEFLLPCRVLASVSRLFFGKEPIDLLSPLAWSPWACLRHGAFDVGIALRSNVGTPVAWDVNGELIDDC